MGHFVGRGLPVNYLIYSQLSHYLCLNEGSQRPVNCTHGSLFVYLKDKLPDSILIDTRASRCTQQV